MLDLRLLAPKSVAIIGASPDPDTLRGRIRGCVPEREFSGPIYPISRNAEDIDSIQCRCIRLARD